VDSYVSQLPIKIGEFLDHVNFTVAPLYEHAVVLGMDWLSINNVLIQCAKHQAILWDKINKIPLTLKGVVHDRIEEIFLQVCKEKK
jgi:acetyltransferase-like isoleucine patch superfamily enzyme